MDLVRECPQPTLNWMFADRDGHIGMQGGGWMPKRNPANSGLLPVPAWDEANHWRGRLESYYLPRIYDPPEGFIATANENINRARRADCWSRCRCPIIASGALWSGCANFRAATVTEMQAIAIRRGELASP